MPSFGEVAESGRTRLPAKEVTAARWSVGSNPTLSAQTVVLQVPRGPMVSALQAAGIDAVGGERVGRKTERVRLKPHFWPIAAGLTLWS